MVHRSPITAPTACTSSRPHIDKTYALDGNTITVSWQLTGLAGRQFSTVLNLAMPSCDSFLGRYALADGSIGGFGQPLTLPAASTVQLEDGVLGGHLCLRAGTAADISGQAHQTVSQSRPALKIMQAVELRLNWRIPDDSHTLQLHLTIEATPT